MLKISLFSSLTITDVFKKQKIQSTQNNNFGFIIYGFESTDVSVRVQHFDDINGYKDDKFS